MAHVPPKQRDAVDHHVARWTEYLKDRSDFDPEVEGALVRMGSIMKSLRRIDAAAFADSDFTLEDYKTLHVLMVQPYPIEATPAQLAEVSNVTRAAMTSRLDRLVAADLITREVDPLDRRRVIVRPTPAGRDLWESYLGEGMEREQHLLAALSQKDLQQLNALLRKVMLALDT